MSLQQDVKVKLLYWYIENGRSVVSAQRAFKVHYKTLKAPARNTIMNIVKRMEEGGTVGNRKRKGPKKTVRTPENIQKIKKKLADSPHRATRRLSAETAISRSSVRRILNDDIGAFPYKIQMQQKQSESNQKKRIQFATYISKKIEKNF